MKKAIVLHALTAALCLAAALASCSESGILPEVSTSGHSGYIRFAFAGESGISLTRTAGVGAENGADTDSIGIYLFDGSNNFHKAWYRPYTADAIDSDQRIYQVWVNNFPGTTTRLVILRTPQHYSLPRLGENKTLDDMKELTLECPTDGEKLVPPFIMSNKAIGGQPYIETTLSENPALLTVVMKRRVARIDLHIVSQEYDPDQITIQSVIVTKAPQKGQLLDIDNAVAPGEDEDNTLIYTPEQLANNDGENPCNSIYLYPTTLGVNGTGVYVQVEVDGQMRTIDITPATEKVIRANSLYNMPVAVSSISP